MRGADKEIQLNLLLFDYEDVKAKKVDSSGICMAAEPSSASW